MLETHSHSELESLFNALVLLHAHAARGGELQQAKRELQQALKPTERIVAQLQERAETSTDPELHYAYTALVAYTEQAKAALDEIEL